MYQCLDFPRMIGPHLYHSQFMFRCQTEQRQRYTDVVIEISLRIQQVIFLLQNGRYQFLRRSLSVGSCDTDDTGTQFPAVIVGQLLQGLQAIVHQQDTAVCSGIFRIIHYRIAATLRQRLCRKPVSIKRSPLQGNKQGTGRTIPAIGRHPLTFQKTCIQS